MRTFLGISILSVAFAGIGACVASVPPPELVNARVALVTAQHDRVVASYAVLNFVGRLGPQVLNLPTTIYDPSVHYHQVRDSWAGVRTPDGR